MSEIIISAKDIEVQFRVRDNYLTAIRNVSLDIYENEAIAIVGESGSGKSVLTKTFAGMLDANGFISEGSIIFNDDDVSKTDVKLTAYNKRLLKYLIDTLNKFSPLERGAAEYRQIIAREADMKHVKSLSEAEEEDFQRRIKELRDGAVDLRNYVLTLDKHNTADAAEIKSSQEKLKRLDEVLDKVNREYGSETLVLGSQQYTKPEGKGKADVFRDSIKHDFRSPCYTTRWSDIPEAE